MQIPLESVVRRRPPIIIIIINHRQPHPHSISPSSPCLRCSTSAPTHSMVPSWRTSMAALLGMIMCCMPVCRVVGLPAHIVPRGIVPGVLSAPRPLSVECGDRFPIEDVKL
ncbi:hypothetical protein PVAP13_8NG071500 [Panicum virgatum]|uniref:Uncharacterized protein n=1 Tax=Panicum virgatum TaxID=38727 RepID=A0A8T0P830_PANVG|nr:hypothetical protein PVAP13_8NG071500 [Panicum virgatum]